MTSVDVSRSRRTWRTWTGGGLAGLGRRAAQDAWPLVVLAVVLLLAVVLADAAPREKPITLIQICLTVCGYRPSSTACLWARPSRSVQPTSGSLWPSATAAQMSLALSSGIRNRVLSVAMAL